MSEKLNRKDSILRALAMACAASTPAAAVHADSTILEYQFTNGTPNATTAATNLTGGAFGYTNANPGLPPLSNPAFIVTGGAGDPPFYIGQSDWFPTSLGYNENYYTFNVSVAPGYTLGASSLSAYINSRQAVLMDSQFAYSNSPSFSNPVNFDTAAFTIPASNTWNTFTASDAPLSGGVGTYYFRLYGQIDPSGSGTISDLLNMSNVALVGSVGIDSAATNMYWDPSKIGAPGSGGAGTWTGTTAWADGAVDYPWSNTIAEIANFGGATSGTVALGGSVSAVNGINFTTAGYTITGTIGQVLTVAGTINAAADATISASLTTTGAFAKAGAGVLSIAGAASFGTGVSITGGTLKLVGGVIDASTADISSGAVLEYNNSAYTYQTPITYTGTGTLRETGTGNLIFGAYGAINIDLSPGGVVDVEGGTLTGSSSYGGNWTSNQGSLNIASGAIFNAVEAGLTSTMQIDALTGAGTFLGGYVGNSGGLSTVTIGVAGGSGAFSGSIQDNSGAHLAIVKTGTGTETFSGSNSYTGGTSVNAGDLVIGAAAAMPNSTLSIGAASEVQLGAGIGGVTIQSLSITGNGALDLENNHLFIDYGSTDPVAAIRAYIISGRNGGAWNGPGINSSVAALSANKNSYAIGYADSADKGNPAHLSSAQIEIKYTLIGDANLDGVVSGDDFTILVANLGKPAAAWDMGDFNYDGLVNGDDFTALVGNLGKSATGADVTLPASDYAAIDAFATANGLMTAVPEPASFGLAAVGAIGLLRRRSRK
jgi:autotransporter-associated beta strand protein